jgi:hypothetical protein
LTLRRQEGIMAAIMRRTEPDRNPPTNPTKRFRAPMRAVLWVALAADLVVLPLASQAAAYFYTDLNPSGFIESFGYGISGSQQVGSRRDAAGAGHALLWSGTASSAVDLHPSGFKISQAYGSSGSQQVGYGDGHALLWSGTASGVVDLHPSGFFDSEARGISGGQQVGDGRTAQLGRLLLHALLWSGTASSVVDLNPNGFTESVAPGTSGSQQVGSGKLAGTNIRHALLWSGTASSVVDLHPTGFDSSAAFGTLGGQQVGNGAGPATGGNSHALLWSGTAGSVVDLHPGGFIVSQANGTSGSQQVGFGLGPAFHGTHALLWSGTASSVVDLHSFLPTDYADSQATGIDAIGNVVGYATYIPTGSSHAILWTLVPERVVLGNEPGQCGAVYTYSTGSTAATCSPPSGSFFPVGNTTVTCTSTNPPNTFTFNVIVEDREAPLAACRPAPNPSGKKIPVAGKNGDSGQNPDGYYQLLAKDNCDAGLKLFVADTASAFIAGPFASGDIVKITQDPDDTPDSQPGAQNVVAHIHLNGDALLYAVDASGNVGATVLCAVVVPPKVAN